MKEKILPIEFPNIKGSIYGGFWRRLIALFFDMIIFLSIFFIFQYINNKGRIYAFYTLIPSLLFYFTYHIYFVKLYGGTLGKLIVGLRIRNKNGKKVGWKEAILRDIVSWIISIFTTIIFLVPLFKISNQEFLSLNYFERLAKLNRLLPFNYDPISYFSQFWMFSEFIVLLMNKRKRALHDFIAGTVVIKKKFEKYADQFSQGILDKDIATEMEEHKSENNKKITKQKKY